MGGTVETIEVVPGGGTPLVPEIVEVGIATEPAETEVS